MSELFSVCISFLEKDIETLLSEYPQVEQGEQIKKVIIDGINECSLWVNYLAKKIFSLGAAEILHRRMGLPLSDEHKESWDVLRELQRMYLTVFLAGILEERYIRLDAEIIGELCRLICTWHLIHAPIIVTNTTDLMSPMSSIPRMSVNNKGDILLTYLDIDIDE